jgi:cytochrome c553
MIKNKEEKSSANVKKSIWRKILQFTVIGTACLTLLVISGYTYISYKMNARIDATYVYRKQGLRISNDPGVIKEGGRLVLIKGCQACHGADLAGKTLVNDFSLGTISASNLTKGKGGLSEQYSPTDWLYALKHGLSKEGKPLLLMPSHETAKLNQKDLTAIISYCDQIPKVDKVLPKNFVGPLAKTMAFFDKLPLIATEKIDHKQADTAASPESSSIIEKGKYLVVFCSGCHRENFKGGPGHIPGSMAIPNITSSGNLGKWTLSQFQTVLKTGKNPAGRQMNPKDMPWNTTAGYTTDEVRAIYVYLSSIK